MGGFEARETPFPEFCSGGVEKDQSLRHQSTGMLEMYISHRGSSSTMSTHNMQTDSPETTAVVKKLASALSGELITPDDSRYHNARTVWNGMINVFPQAVIRAGSESDIDLVLEAARAADLPLAVRGGGHNVAGHGTVAGGLVLDLSQLRAVEVDAERQLVTVEAGATLSDVDHATAPHQLAVPMGVISATGIAGLTLGGGVGWLTRSCGLTLDNLASARVVTASGEHLHASPEENPDLFWGLRGGGGNFGVVSSFTFHARSLSSPVMAGNFFYQPAHWRDALVSFEQWTQSLPEEMTPIISILVLPPEFDMGEDPWLIVGFVWASEDHTAGSKLIQELRESAPPDSEDVNPISWIEWQSSLDSMFPKGSRGYWKNVSFSRMDREVVNVLVDIASEVTWYGTGIDIHCLGGAFGRVGEDDTAFPNRSARFWLNIYGFWTSPDEDERLTAFAREAHLRMQPFAEQGQYVNFLGAEAGHDMTQAARQAYGLRTYDRLKGLKNTYDPHNLFRLNHNIAPDP